MMHISHPIHFLIHLWIKYATGINTAFNVKKIKYINKTIYKNIPFIRFKTCN